MTTGNTFAGNPFVVMAKRGHEQDAEALANAVTTSHDWGQVAACSEDYLKQIGRS